MALLQVTNILEIKRINPHLVIEICETKTVDVEEKTYD